MQASANPESTLIILDMQMFEHNDNIDMQLFEHNSSLGLLHPSCNISWNEHRNRSTKGPRMVIQHMALTGSVWIAYVIGGIEA